MKKPSEVKEAFDSIEDENYTFRRFLKTHADADKLDRQFLKLHKELFLTCDCSKCRNCCKDYSAIFQADELGPVSDFPGITEKDFIKKYINEEFGHYEVKTKPCCFLKEDGSCEIETCKPESCRDYPFTDRLERLESLLSIVDSARVCPVVFEILERLKDEYGFKRSKRY